MKADELPSGQKQRDIQEDRADTYGKSREQDIQHLGQSRNAAHTHGVSGKKPVEGQCEDHRAHCYNAIASQLFFQMDFSLSLSIRPEHGLTAG